MMKSARGAGGGSTVFLCDPLNEGKGGGHNGWGTKNGISAVMHVTPVQERVEKFDLN
jgi:hypothetical protein